MATAPRTDPADPPAEPDGQPPVTDDYQPPAPIHTDRIVGEIPALSPPWDAQLLPLVHELVDDWVQAAQQYGPIPPVRSAEFLDAEPAQQIAALLVLGAAWLVNDPHRVIRGILREVQDDIHASTDWRAVALNHVPHDELRRRRAQPGPLAADPPHPGDPHRRNGAA